MRDEYSQLVKNIREVIRRKAIQKKKFRKDEAQECEIMWEQGVIQMTIRCLSDEHAGSW